MLIKPAKHTAPENPGRRLALVICNGKFSKIPGIQLSGPSKDAILLESILSDPDICRFSVTVLVDRGLLEVRREIARICSEAGEEDTLLIYYSGNGLVGEDGCLYLVVDDSENDYLYATALDAEFILSQLRRSKCRKIVLLVDSCHAGAFFNNNRGIPNGLYAITSCGADEYCSDTPEGGAFTMAVCAGLRHSAADTDGDGVVSIDELHEFVKNQLQPGSGIPQKWVWNVPEPIYMASIPPHVFFSYARVDHEAADQLKKTLESKGVSLWIDREDILSGNWKERVMEGLNRSCAVLLLLTEHSINSDTVKKELAFAANKNVPIIPVQLGGMPEKLLPDWFILDYGELHRHILDPKGYEEGVKKLISAIHRVNRTDRKPTALPTATIQSTD
jgi:hypothetical protein